MNVSNFSRDTEYQLHKSNFEPYKFTAETIYLYNTSQKVTPI